MASNVLRHPAFWRPALALCMAAVVVAGAYVAEKLSRHMMSAVAGVGAWVMFAFLVSYLVVRFRPSVGAPMLVGFGAGAAFVAVVGGMTMAMS